MNACLNCGAELRFDIRSQCLLCPSCGTKEQPQTYSAFGDYAYESPSAADQVDAILYSCPQCGGSIYTTSESVNGFCSYCGANVMLESRFVRMKAPRYVAPFRIDKEDCKQRYLEYAKKAFFAPDEFKDPKYLDRFRGIYMTYWGYNVDVEGFLYLDGIKEFNRLPYHITEFYKCMGWVHAEYRGIFYDASSSFEDHYSEQIAPFNYHAMVDFNPAYLSGFYADLPDLDYDVYEENAIAIGKDNLFHSPLLRRNYPDMKFDEGQKERFRETMDTRCSAVYTVFFPIWFLSYRRSDDVAYAVVNGQTGRLVSDLPIDKKKFISMGFLLSVPIFLLLFFLPNLPLPTLLITSESFSLLSVLLLLFMLERIQIRRDRLYDKGYLAKHDAIDYRYRLLELEEKKRKRLLSYWPLFALAAIFLIAVSPKLFRFLSALLGGFAPLLALLLSILLEILLLKNVPLILYAAKKKGVLLFLSLLIIFGASLWGTHLLFRLGGNRPEMYLVISALLFGTVLSQLSAVEQYNRMVCRPLPQLKREGGNDSAWN